MAVGIGSPGNTFALMPTREVGLLVDPLCLPYSSYAHVIRLVQDLRTIDPPITIQLHVPIELLDQSAASQMTKLPSIFSWVPQMNPPLFKLSTDIQPDVRGPLLATTTEATRCSQLLSIADAIQADGIVTADELLSNARYPLYQWHRIRIIPLQDLGDLVEVFAHGHSVFWSCTNEDRYMISDLFYQQFHWKGLRYGNWFSKIESELTKPELKESLRSALLNRYPFILHCRDIFRWRWGRA